MPTYLDAIGGVLAREAARRPNLLQFGENIAHGSKLCGAARRLTGRILTVGNCENTHVGVGLGMMLEGGEALLVVKQLDFLLLAADQLVNTMNLIRASRDPSTLGSFTIAVIVCDQGWQGPQSSFHDLAGLCALARVDGYHLNGLGDAERVLASHLVRPGFRLIGLSQGRFGSEVLAVPVTAATDNCAELQYSDGREATIAALGFTLPKAIAMSRGAAVFQINPVLPHLFAGVTASAARTKRLIILDDGKGAVSLGHKIASQVLRVAPDCHVSLQTREDCCDYTVNADAFV